MPRNKKRNAKKIHTMSKRKHIALPNKPPTGALSIASKALMLAIKAAEAGEQQLATLESQLEKAQSDLARIRQGLTAGDELDREPVAARGRRLRDSIEPLRQEVAEALADLQRLTAVFQTQAAKLAGELAKLASARFERAVMDAQKALAPWCQPATAARLANQTDAANRERARMMQSHFCPTVASARSLLAAAEQALRDA
jgi:hypothetical protein